MRQRPFPKPKHSYELKLGQTSRSEYKQRLYKFCLPLGLRFINSAVAEGRPTPTQDEIATYIDEVIWHRGKEHITDWYTHGTNGGGPVFGLLDADVGQIATGVARAVLFYWDPEFMNRVRARAASGGRKSRRPPMYSPDLLDGLEGLSKAEQAKRLGASTATVGRLRAARARTLAKPTH